MKTRILCLIVGFMGVVGCYGQDVDDCVDVSKSTLDTEALAMNSVIPSTNAISHDAQNLPAFDYKSTPEWHTYRVMRAVGWSTLGVGLGTTLVGLALAGVSLDAAPSARDAAAITLISGASLTLASIPIICVAYHNRSVAKSKAKTLSFGVSQIATPTSQFNYNYTPAMSLSLIF